MLERASLKTTPIYLDGKHSRLPDHECFCDYCHNSIGTLRPEHESPRSRYSPSLWNKYMLRESGLMPDPPQIARWAIQNYTQPMEKVLDPFMGTGTTIVEAINNSRIGFGFEEDAAIFNDAGQNVQINVDQGAPGDYRIHNSPAQILWRLRKEMNLIYTVMPTKIDEIESRGYVIDRNLSLLDKHAPESYWEVLTSILDLMVRMLKNGGHLVFSIQDSKRYNYHETICDLVLTTQSYAYVGQIFTPLTKINTHRGKLEDFYRTFVWRKTDENL